MSGAGRMGGNGQEEQDSIPCVHLTGRTLIVSGAYENTLYLRPDSVNVCIHEAK